MHVNRLENIHEPEISQEDNQHFAHDRRGGGVRSFFILRADVMIEAGIPSSSVIPSIYEYCEE